MKKGSTTAAVLGNWRFSAITTLQSGRPFSIGASNNPIAGAGSARADLVGSGYPVLDTGRSKGEELAAYFDKTRFTNPAPNAYGTLGRNAFRGSGRTNIDLSISKLTNLSAERVRLEIIGNFFNVFNHAQFNNPQNRITSGTFGQISATGDPRIIQLAGRLTF